MTQQSTSRGTLLAMQIQRDWWWVTISLVIFTAILSIFSVQLGLKRLDLTFYDFLSSTGLPAPKPNTALIVIDEKSLDTIGYWPWRRTEYVKTLNYLHEAKAVGIDILFNEPNPTYPNDDNYLAYAIESHGKVVLPSVINHNKTEITLPNLALAEAAAAIGYINSYPDSDGVIRRTHLYTDVIDSTSQHFTLALLNAAGDTEIAAQQRKLSATNLIPFYGPPGSFDIFSFSDVAAGKYSPEIFKDRYVLIGAWASGLGDFYPTPLSTNSQPSMSGVEILANTLENALHNHWRKMPPNSVNAILSILPILFICLVLKKLTPRRALLSAIAVISLVFIASWILLFIFHTWVPPTAALIGTILSYPVWYWRSQETVLQHINNELSEMRDQDPALRISLKGSSAKSPLPVRLSYLHQAIELLREAQQRREETLRFISHDMRAPQNSILALVTMQRNNELKLDTESMLKHVENYASTTLELVDDFMDLARVEAMEVTFEPIFLNSLVAEVCDDAWIRAQSKHINIVFDEPDYDIWITGSPTLLKRAFNNLIDNAIKYSSEYTTVTCKIVNDNNQAHITFTDQGWGIPVEYLPTIFQPFKRAHTQQSDAPKGSGLGLAFVHTVILRNSGTITVQSISQVGTTFTVLLPLAPAEN